MAKAVPSVSIVMPTLNQRPFIDVAVRSVFSQQGVGELIVADGGSSDGTLQSLESLAAAHPGQLHWISESDSGPAQAVNRAVARARGEVVGWLNSDDLLAPGSVQRSMAALSSLLGSVMVYGEGEHIDADGASLGRYPTLPPSTPIDAFAQGCFICQPTVFFRRDAFLAVGGLDEALRTAFDFDLWLRMFKAYPGRIAFVPQVQAQSRLHAGSITLRQREAVALEAMAVLRRHLGHAPPHWLLTHFEERCASHPFSGGGVDLYADLSRLAQAAEPCLSAEGSQALSQWLRSNAALRLSSPQVFAPVHADAWAPPTLDIRVRQPSPPYTVLRILGRHADPRGLPLRASAPLPDGRSIDLDVPTNGPFEWLVPIAHTKADANIVVRIQVEGGFVPMECEPGSTDGRCLAYLVDAVQLVGTA